MTKVNYNFSLQTGDGPLVQLSAVYDVDVIDNGSPMVKKSTDLPINIQAVGWDKVEFIIIQSVSPYDPAGNIKYTVGNLHDIALTQPHFLVGNALVKLLGTGTTDNTVTIKNRWTQDVIVKVIVGRKAS
jgi:hypothetical protein